MAGPHSTGDKGQVELSSAPVLPPAPLAELANVVLGEAFSDSLDGFDLRGLAPLIAALQVEPGACLSQPTRTQARRLAATHMVIEETAERAIRLLEDAGHEPVVLKGLAVAEVYARRELRPTADVDLLVRPECFEEARSVLEADGWRSVANGTWAEDYLRTEGYCWQAKRPGAAVLELHFRLWGSVASGYAEAVHAAATSNGSRRRPCPEDLVVIAASHAWRQAPPRRGADFVDVALVLARTAAFDYSRLLRRSSRSGQVLPLALCLQVLRPALTPEAVDWLDHQLLPSLRSPERRLFEKARSLDPDRLGWSSIRLAMLLADRPSRIGWKGVWRRVWPHPALIERRYAGHPGWIQRWLHVTRLWR